LPFSQELSLLLMDACDLAYVEETLARGEPLRAGSARRLLAQHRDTCAKLAVCLEILEPLAFPGMELDRLPAHAEFQVWFRAEQVLKIRDLLAAIEAGDEAPGVLHKTGEGR
jgi:hypothetical protein